MTDTANKGGHGFDPTITEMHASLIINGPGMKGQGNVGIVRMTQIAPTLAGLLRVSLSPQADQPLEALLKARRVVPEAVPYEDRDDRKH